uniref:Transporter n=1 Tax=Ciona savignyi TaxID=51511 RepID=H2YBA4_CIOSA
RQSWKKSIDFLFSTSGYCIGLGNLWRFPYLCFENGGGAFLIPYLLFTCVFAIPMMILETSFGQSFRSGVIKSWERIPIFKGIAFAQLVANLYASSSYIIIMTWITKYLVSSVSSNLPWTSCENQWNTKHCVSLLTSHNSTNNVTLSELGISAAEEFWSHEVLGKSGGLEHVGSLRPDLVLYLSLIWIAGYFVTFKGIKWSSKVFYVTATLPVVLIIVVTIRGCTLDGAWEGLRFYLYPDLSKLMNFKVWITAAEQVTYSIAVGNGMLLFLASFNKRNQNFCRDALIIAAANAVTSFISGLAVFSSLGFLATKLNTTMAAVASSGPGLVFIAYPQSISLLPFPQVWSFLFFLILLLLGFDSQFVQVEYLVNFFIDGSKRIRSRRWNREILGALLCFFNFLIGLSMVSEVSIVLCKIGSLRIYFNKTFDIKNGGIYVFEIFNRYGVAGWCIFLLSGCELVAISWFYGLDIHFKEIESMIGTTRGKFLLKMSWKFISPVICMAVVVISFSGFKLLRIGSYLYPPWAQCLAHLLSVSTVIAIPVYAVYIKLKSGKSFAQV